MGLQTVFALHVGAPVRVICKTGPLDGVTDAVGGVPGGKASDRLVGTPQSAACYGTGRTFVPPVPYEGP